MLGVKRTTKIYNPNYGYEPYWANGDWVIQNKVLPPGLKTTPVPLVCGEECLEIYTPIGQVCGRNARNVGYKGCTPTVWSWFCSGGNIDDQAVGYHTFQTYCQFLNKQCRGGAKETWIFVHRGRCEYPQWKLFRPISVASQAINRMKFFLTSLATEFNRHKIQHTILG